MANIALNQPISGGVASTTFFNGRLLSAEDLRAEQESNRKARQILGQAVGEGIAYGLMVSETASSSPPSTPSVTIEAGVALNRNGLALRLPDRVDVQLAKPVEAGTAPQSTGFRECQPSQQGVYITGEGAYVLVISPAAFRDGQAPASGFGGITATCTTRSTVDTVQFRLLPLTGADLSDTNKARNRIAYQCFNPTRTQDAASDPYAGVAPQVSLLDSLRPGLLTGCDVPLAVISWSVLTGIRFIDNWSVRRRVVAPSMEGPFLPETRRAEVEAMILQFDEQVRFMRLRELNLELIACADRFDFLPPVGMLPVRSTGLPTGFDVAQFFGTRASQDIGMLDAEGLRSLHAEALDHEPLNLAATPTLQLYRIFENVKALERGVSRQAAVLFASPALGYRGVARFAYGNWGSSRFANGVI